MKLALLLCCLPLLASARSPSLLGAHQPCWDEKKQLDATKEQNGGVLAPGAEYPTCDRLGRYSLKQCSGSQCYCVDPDGATLMKTEQDSYTKNRWEAEAMACRCARKEFEIRQVGNFGRTVQCDEKGDYRHTQCAGSACFCIHPVSGELQQETQAHVADYAELTAKCAVKEY